MGTPRMTRIVFPNAAPIMTGRCRVLAEAGQCMEGSVERAVDMVRNAANAGAWGMKVQLLRPDTIATARATKYWDDTLGTTTQREAFEAAGLVDYDRWGPVRDECRKQRIAFVASPFDLEAVDALEAIDVDAYKVASGDLLYRPLLDRIVDTRRPLIIATGAAWHDEIETTVEHVLDRDPSARYRLVLLACSLVYPTPDDDANVGRVVRLREMIAEHGWNSVRVGYSDHTTSTMTPGWAAAAGACVVEKHYTYRGATGAVADHGMAVDPDGLAECVVNAERGAVAFGDPVIAPTLAEERARYGARRGLYLVRRVNVGDRISADDVAVLRPSPHGAMPPDVWHDALLTNVATWRVTRDPGELVANTDLDLGIGR